MLNLIVAVIAATVALWPASAEELYQAPVLESADGKLEVTLTIKLGESLNKTRLSPLYNGQPMGPTLKVKPGDVLTLTLDNQLPTSSAADKAKMAMLKDPTADANNVTKMYNRLKADGSLSGEQWGQHFMNIHLHGLQVDPSAVDARVSIDGGESKTYTITIPKDHPAGLGWYHNHNHGTASFSMLSGLYGFIEVVDPSTSALSDPAVAAATAKYLILGESKVGPTKTPADSIGIVFDFGWTAVTNGQVTPTMTVKQGETVLFRAASASVEPDYTLEIAGIPLMPIAVDGHPLTGTVKNQSTVTVIPGGRVEFLAQFGTPGTYTMTRAAWNAGITGKAVCAAVFGPTANVDHCVSFDFERDVLQIVVESDATFVGSALPTNLVAGAGAFLDALVSVPATSARNVTLQMLPGGFQLPVSSELAKSPGFTQLGINGRIAHPLYEHPTPFVQGTCETWEVNAAGAAVSHPFHLHGMPFLVTHASGKSLETPEWRDTYHTPVVFTATGPATSSFTAHVCFTRWNAYVMAHCHMPSHEDVGMSAIFSMVAPPQASTSAAATTAAASTTATTATHSGAGGASGSFAARALAVAAGVSLIASVF